VYGGGSAKAYGGDPSTPVSSTLAALYEVDILLSVYGRRFCNSVSDGLFCQVVEWEG